MARYVYFKNDETFYVYSKRDITKPINPVLKIGGLIISLAILATLVFVTIRAPQKLVSTEKEFSAYPSIMDNAQIINEPNVLADSIAQFFEKTGIIVTVATVDESAWKNNYDSFYPFVNELYLKSFNDENHWLIACSVSQKNVSLETYRGIEADKLLTQAQNKMEKFWEILNKYRQADRSDIGKAISSTLNDFPKTVMHKYLPTPAFIVYAILLFAIIAVYRSICEKEKLYKNAKLCPEDFSTEEECTYCGGTYIIGVHTSCPHCGAPIKAHDYTSDKSGKITGILN